MSYIPLEKCHASKYPMLLNICDNTRVNTGAKEFALYAADPGSIPIITYVPLSTSRCDPMLPSILYGLGSRGDDEEDWGIYKLERESKG